MSSGLKSRVAARSSRRPNSHRAPLSSYSSGMLRADEAAEPEPEDPLAAGRAPEASETFADDDANEAQLAAAAADANDRASVEESAAGAGAGAVASGRLLQLLDLPLKRHKQPISATGKLAQKVLLVPCSTCFLRAI